MVYLVACDLKSKGPEQNGDNLQMRFREYKRLYFDYNFPNLIRIVQSTIGGCCSTSYIYPE